MPPGPPPKLSVSAPLSIPLLGGVTLLAASVGGLFHFKQPGNVALWQILLKKSFSVGGRNFLAPLMRFARGDVEGPHRSHSKAIIDPSYLSYGACSG